MQNCAQKVGLPRLLWNRYDTQYQFVTSSTGVGETCMIQVVCDIGIPIVFEIQGSRHVSDDMYLTTCIWPLVSCVMCHVSCVMCHVSCVLSVYLSTWSFRPNISESSAFRPWVGHEHIMISWHIAAVLRYLLLFRWNNRVCTVAPYHFVRRLNEPWCDAQVKQ